MLERTNRPRLRPFANPTRALLWEQWRSFLPFLGGAFMMAAAGALGLYINVRQHKIVEADAVYLTDLVRRLCSVALPALLCAGQGGRTVAFPQRMYRLPVTSRLMTLYVAVPRLLFLVVTLVMLLAFRVLLFGAPDGYSEVCMVVLSVEALLAGLGLSWWLGAFRDWPAVLGLVLVAGLSWAMYEILCSEHIQAWLWPEIVLPLAGCWAAGWTLVVLAGPFRARSGVGLLWRLRGRGRDAAQAHRVSGGPIRLRRFSSPFAAQAWYERRTRGYAGLLYPLLFFASIALLLLDSRFFDLGGYVPVFATMLGVAVQALGICFVAAAGRRLVEAYRVRAGQFRFLAAKPISTQDLARARLNAMWKSVEAALLFTLAITVFFWLVPPKPVLLTPSIWPLWLADAYQSFNERAFTWVLLWVALLWTGASMTALSTPKAIGMLAVWPLLQLTGTYEPVRVFLDAGGNEAVVALTGLCLGVHTVRMFMHARRKGLLLPLTATLSVAVYSVLTYLILQNIVFRRLWDPQTLDGTNHLVWTIEIVGALSLVVAPVAALPLQFDRWRHGGK